MNKKTIRFLDDGYVVINDLLGVEEIDHVDLELGSSFTDIAGDRRFLDREWCRLLAHVIRHRLLKRRLLYRASQPILCTYFNKDPGANWGVNLHRDLHVPLRRKIDDKNWSNWSDKQGIPHARAPRDILATMVAVRVQVDDCDPDDGALQVIPGSHATPDVDAGRVACSGQRGSAIVISPLLLHSQPKSHSGRPQRVLHFLYGPDALPGNAQWYY